MIDLHSHILPGLDDGSPDLETSLAMARAAVADGVQTMVATPHVSSTYTVEVEELGQRVGSLNLALARERIPLAVLSGAEVAVPELSSLDDIALRALCLGGAGCLLVESPYADVGLQIEEVLFDTQVRGVRVMLAHPERCAIFQHDAARLEALVERGVMACVNVGSLAGRFGRRAERAAVELLERGVVHALASDAHDERRRPPGIRAALHAAAESHPGLLDLEEALTTTGPAAVLAGDEAQRVQLPPRRRSFVRRVLRRP